MTLASSTDSVARLALLGGKPVYRAEAKQYPVWSEDARAEVDRLLDGGVAMGLSKSHPQIGAVESALASYHGVPWALSTSTGNGALQAALIGLELTAGDEVITSPYTYGVSISCILQNNCIATFADVVEGTGLLDPDSVEERLTERTRAVLVPHIFGNPADMTRLSEVARKHGLKVIEDGSQAHGARHRGGRVGAFGDAAGFSANGVKPLAATEAGYMLAKDPETYWKAVVSTQHAGMGELPGRATEDGFPQELDDAVDGLIYSFRLSPINAVLMLDVLKRLDGDNEVRRKHLELLRDGFGDLNAVSVPDLLYDDDESAVHQVIVHFDEARAGVSKATYMKAVNAEGLYCHEYLPRPVNKAPRLSPEWKGPRVMWTENLRRAGYDATKLDLPHAERQVAEHFNLVWNYVQYDPAFIGRILDVFAKVDGNLDALRAFEER